jgi:hypothetical protein
LGISLLIFIVAETGASKQLSSNGLFHHNTLITRNMLSFSVGQYTTVFQAKAHAIKSCVVEHTDRGYDSGNAGIYPGSCAATGAFKHY